MTTLATTALGGLGPGRRVAVWTVAGVVVYVVAAIVTVFAIAAVEQIVLVPAGFRAEAGTAGLSLRNGAHAIVWGVVAAGVSVPIGRRLVDGVRFGWTGWLVLAVGLVLAAGTTFLVEEFVRARFGLFRPRATGWTIFSGPALVAVSLATWAALAVPRPARVVVAMAAALAVVGFALSVLPSVSGLRDGIDSESVPLAAVLVAGGLFATAGLALVVAKDRPRDLVRA